VTGTAPPDPATGEVIVHVFGRTDVGRVRDHNEDSFLVADLSAENASLQPEVRTHPVGPRGTLFMVADGLGGAAAGEIASDLAINTVYEEIRERWVKSERSDPQTFAAALKAATDAANSKIFSYAIEHPEHRGLGTTATVVGFLGDTVYVAQVGDSRAYVIRKGEAIQITKDQSLMQRLVEAGELTQEEADRSERRNIILQALGPEPTVRIDLTHQQLRRGDELVLCTDGLSGLVKKEEIAEVVSESTDLVSACKELIDRANENGGPDNITVIVAKFEGAGLREADEADHLGHAVYALPGSTPQGGVSRPDESPTAPSYRRPSPASRRTPDGVEVGAPNTAPDPTAGTPIPAGGAVRELRRQLLTALAATLALLGVFFLARRLRVGPAPSDGVPTTPAPRSVAPVDSSHRTVPAKAP
jgi:serine/threonine protein phosphatase PrpC